MTSAAAFGNYDVFSGVPNDTTATIQTSCMTLVSVAVTYTLSFSTGAGGSYAGRKMLNGAASLSYQLYTNPTRSSVWGDGSAGTSTVSDGYLLAIATPILRSYTAYGRITAGQLVPIAGAYNDSILITLTY